MAEGIWFQQSVEGLFVRGVGERMTPALRGKLLELGIDLARLQPGYPNSAVSEAIRFTGAELFPDRPEREALRAVGALFMDGYQHTFMGRAMVQLMKVIGARRSLERMERNFRTGGNFLETRFTSLGQGKVELWFNDVGDIADFYAGVMERGGQLTGAADISVTFTRDAPPACTYLVTWSE